MPTISDAVTTPDGTCPVTLAIPDGDGPWPGVILYPDAGGARAALRDMAERLAGLGYVVLVPDVYYRSGDWAPFSMKDVFNDKAERQRLFAMIGSVTPDAMESDARAFFDYLAARPLPAPAADGAAFVVAVRDPDHSLRVGDARLKNAAVGTRCKGVVQLSPDEPGDITICCIPGGWIWIIPFGDGVASVGAVMTPASPITGTAEERLRAPAP